MLLHQILARTASGGYLMPGTNYHPDDIMTFDLSEREKLALTASPLPTMTKITIRCRWRQPSRQALATPYRGYVP